MFISKIDYNQEVSELHYIEIAQKAILQNVYENMKSEQSSK